MIEWPECAAEPDHYWLCTLAADISLERMIDQARLPLAFARAWLADRARLSRTQTRGRPRPLRRSRLAWLPSSRNSLCRSLRIPDLRNGDDSALRTSPHLARHTICTSRRLSTRRVAAPVATPYAELDRNAAHPPRAYFWREHCLDVLVADRCVRGPSCRMSDGVGVGNYAGHGVPRIRR